MPTIPSAIDQFRVYLQRRNYAAHTLQSYLLDLNLFFTDIDKPLDTISFREIDRFMDKQHAQRLTAATINRRLYALKHCFDFLIEHQLVSMNPVKPSHVLRRGRSLPKALSKEQLEQVFAQIHQPMDHTLFLVMLRYG